ncbi:THUMP-like domain-containing protein [Hyunsoonleella ulvae]|uniref:THUMP-like domain-containing protein n=1 Tax=Hyunsoonleella ulvae TaxID=2799948 RepID=UPI00193AD1FA|nr:class I SAM-dependent methyltransferase [Hyunsoonleella ulvae]
MNTSILNIEVQEFINSNLNSDINKILLKGITFEGVETPEIVNHIEAKKRCKLKLPTWFKTKNIYYPNKLNIEQTSSEITAKYKSEIIKGNSLIDITGGFGVDSYYFAKRFKTVTHCEINTALSSIVKHNFKQLNIQNIEARQVDGITLLSETNTTYDWIYVDPSRRHDSKGKVFFLKDCLPDVPKHLEVLFQRSKNILIKTAPLLDISAGINELQHVKTIHIVAVKNEVKELLWVLETDYDSTIAIKTANLKNDAIETFNFGLNDEIVSEVSYSEPLAYLYEPNAAILKSGGFNQVSKQLNIFKLQAHSHLYTSQFLIDFPGRRFKIDTVIPYNKKRFKTLKIDKANVTTRNFPDKVEAIRKKLKLKDGGNHYLFFTTDTKGNKIIISCSKI